MRARMARRLVIVVSGVLAMGLAWPSSAHAAIAGPCTAELNGADLSRRSPVKKSHAVVVRKNTVVTYSGESLVPPNQLKIDLEFLGFLRWTVTRKRLNGRDRTWSSTAEVNKYARYGVGLYRVYGRALGPRSCVGSALIRVRGNPLTTAGGIAGAASSGIGIFGITLGTTRAGRLRSVAGMSFWLLSLVAPVIGIPAAAGAGRARNRPVLSFSGILGGLFLGLGVAALLQQYSVLYPTRNVTIAAVAAGVLLGILFPSFARMSAVRRANARQAAPAAEQSWQEPPPEGAQRQQWQESTEYAPPPPPEEPPAPPWEG